MMMVMIILMMHDADDYKYDNNKPGSLLHWPQKKLILCFVHFQMFTYKIRYRLLF